MTNFEYAAITFGATFAGVIFSFILWFGGSFFIKWRENRKVLKAMMREIFEEIQLNTGVLSLTVGSIQKALGGIDIPLFFPKLKHSASSYAVSSGEVRIIKNIRKRRIVGYLSLLCESHNHFAENTERILALLLLRKDSIDLVRIRLDGFLKETNEKKLAIEDFQKKLTQKNLPEDGEDTKTNNTNNSSVDDKT